MLNRRDFLIGSAAAAAASASMLAPIPSFARRWRLPEKRPVKVIENAWIPMPDGVRLGVRLWIPEGAEQSPVPVVLEYLPYRKRDGVRARDEATAANLAPYGIAFARVDIRGTGDSEGVMTDEYAEPEMRDGLEVIAWLARQPWSNGSVGMRGISWGGINSLQVAALQPPALKAIMPMGCVDRRFTQDAHYIGGALATENFKWGTYFKMYMGAPPDPQISGPAWEARWRERLEASPPILERWTRHQRDDAYWRRGSVSVDYARIRCPVYVVAGWLDPYSDSVPTLLAGLEVPRRALIGPWGHLMPNLPEPLALDWAYEEVRWWRQWLAGEDTGILEEPMLRAYMPDRTLSEVYPQAQPGRWIAESVWPSPHLLTHRLHLGRGTLGPPGSGSLRYRPEHTVGALKSQWMPSLPQDQRADDAKSLVFDSSVLSADLEILGTARVRLRLACDQSLAQVAARLNELLPDGSSRLVTYGLLNLTHRDSHEQPTALTPGTAYEIQLPLYAAAHRFKRGSRLRLALSQGLWPMVWPAPHIATLTLMLEGCSLELPVRPRPAHESPFPIPEIHRPGASAYLPGESSLDQVFDSAPKRQHFEDIGTTVETRAHEELHMLDGQPASSRWSQENSTRWLRGDWDCTVGAAFELTATEASFRIRETLWAKKGEEEIFRREQLSTVGRDLL